MKKETVDKLCELATGPVFAICLLVLMAWYSFDSISPEKLGEAVTSSCVAELARDQIATKHTLVTRLDILTFESKCDGDRLAKEQLSEQLSAIEKHERERLKRAQTATAASDSR